MFWRDNEPNGNQNHNKFSYYFNSIFSGGLIIVKFVWRWFLRGILLPIYQFSRWIKQRLSFDRKQSLTEIILKTPVTVLVIFIVLFITWRNVNADEIRLDSIGKSMALYRIVPSVDGLPVSYFDEEITEGRTNLNNNSLDQDYFNADLEARERENIESLDLPAPGQTELGLDQNALLLPIITSPDKTNKIRDGITKYTVNSGDTVSGIATAFGLKINTLLWANNLTLRSTLKPGQSLIIPPLDGVIHTIKKGDSIGKIAKTYGADADAIVAANKLASSNDIRINQEIIVPGGKPIAVAPTPVPYRQQNQTNPPKRPGTVAGANAQPSADGKLLWPTTSRRLSQYFNWRHYGIDVPNKVGQPIYAIQSGTVETAGWNRGGYGYYVIINHGNGMRSLYAHSSELYVSAGDRVVQGQVISAIGNTGRSTGPHLHFEIRINGKTVNPLSYVR